MVMYKAANGQYMNLDNVATEEQYLKDTGIPASQTGQDVANLLQNTGYEPANSTLANTLSQTIPKTSPNNPPSGFMNFLTQLGAILPALGLAGITGGVAGELAPLLTTALDVPITAGETSAGLGALTGAGTSGLEGKNPITGALQGAAGAGIGDAASGLGASVGGGGLGALTSGLAGAGGSAGLSAATGGTPSVLNSLTAGLGAASGGASQSNDIQPYQSEDIQQQIVDEPGVTLPGVSGSTIGSQENVLPTGGYSAPTSSPGSTQYNQSNLSSLLGDASGASQIGSALQNLLKGLSTSAGSGNIVEGTNEISTPVTAAQASAITPTGTWTDRQLYDALQAIQQRYATTGQGNSPAEQAEIQALLAQQVG